MPFATETSLARMGLRAPHSSPCIFGIAWVGRISGVAGGGMAWPTVAVGLAVAVVAGASIGFGCTTAACCEDSGAGLAGAGLGTGTVWLATRGTEAGGRGPPRITVGGGSALCGP